MAKEDLFGLGWYLTEVEFVAGPLEGQKGWVYTKPRTCEFRRWESWPVEEKSYWGKELIQLWKAANCLSGQS